MRVAFFWPHTAARDLVLHAQQRVDFALSVTFLARAACRFVAIERRLVVLEPPRDLDEAVGTGALERRANFALGVAAARREELEAAEHIDQRRHMLVHP